MRQDLKELDHFSLGAEEENNIKLKVNFELNEMQLKMIKVGGITNILTGLFVIWILRNQINVTLLVGWYLALVIINIINIAFSYLYKYSRVTPQNIKPWLRVYHVILGMICLVWGSMGVLFASSSVYYQLYTITFLQVVLFGFTFGTITDFTATVISAICLLLPYLSFSVYTLWHSMQLADFDSKLHFGFALSLLILGLFLTITCFIGYLVIRKSYMLTFLNQALSKKLENMNKFLEQRVRERTIELESSLKQVTYQANHDLLTELPNQRLLLKYLTNALRSAEQAGHIFCVVSFSINELDRIIDGLGYHTGEFAIQTIALRLQKAFKQPIENIRYLITLSRKDVFVILIEPIFTPEEVEKRAEKLFTVLEHPIDSGQHTIKLTGSLGVSIYPRDGKNAKTLIMNADAAMIDAKQQGGNAIRIYKTEINADLSNQIQLESNLHEAVKKGEFMLQYQPFIDLTTGSICGVESLVRWQHPVLGLISPDNFIPLSEANGLIIPLGEWVLRTACLQMKHWHENGFKIRVAVNLSAKQLQHKNIFQSIKNILNEAKIEPRLLEFELTETEVFKADVVPLLKQLKELGVFLSIDDFGTGYSGLSNLKIISIDKLKIDKSFVRDIETNHDSQMIVSHTINLAKKIRVKVIAEGVETKGQVQFLKEHGCDMAQGYYFSRPVDVTTCTKLLESNTQFSI